MRIALVLTNPSNKVSKKSPTLKNLYSWMDFLQLAVVSFCNVSIHKTNNNRPLKRSEYELDRLSNELKGYHKVISFGAIANKALKLLEIEHFNMPHPSPRNFKLNDINYLEQKLNECKKYCTK